MFVLVHFFRYKVFIFTYFFRSGIYVLFRYLCTFSGIRYFYLCTFLVAGICIYIPAVIRYLYLCTLSGVSILYLYIFSGIKLTLSTLIEGKGLSQGGHKVGLGLEIAA